MQFWKGIYRKFILLKINIFAIHSMIILQCDSEGDDDKVSDAGSGFSNTHPFTGKSSKPNSTPPLVENVSTNSSNLESITAKTDLNIDQKVVTELPPPALPSPITTTQINKQVCLDKLFLRRNVKLIHFKMLLESKYSKCSSAKSD